jgi:lipoxygenase
VEIFQDIYVYSTIFFYTDPLYEERSTLDFYVPRDEAFAETKQTQFNTSAVSLGLTTIIQSLDAIVTDINLGFENFEDIEAIYKEGFQLPNLESNDSNFLQKLIPKFFKDANDSQNIVRFDTPEPYKSKFKHINEIYLI